MSILTKEQIEEVVHIFLNNRDTNAVVIKTAMENWNSNQTAQFEPDWSKAPRDVKGAILKSYWVGGDMCTLGQTVAEYKRPAPAITPHPHAAIMAKYAEVAARRVDPWVEFERFSHCDMEWDGLPYHPDWTQGQEYRYIGDDK